MSNDQIMKISLDTETTGIDFHHGTKPFLVTTCNEKLETSWWEWHVDPLTREPQIPTEDLDEIDAIIQEADELVLHNTKFDFKALQSAWPHSEWEFPWDKVQDTLIASHIIDSSPPHTLTVLSLIHLQLNIKPWEDEIEKAVKEAKRIVQDKYPDWMVAKVGLSCMPSAKEKVWKFDMWLPRAVAKAEEYPKDHPWWHVLSDYANVDSSSTIQLYGVLKKLLEENGLWEIYQERLKLLPIVYEMETQGITANEESLDELYEDYRIEYDDAGRACTEVASAFGYELELPKGAVNNSLKSFCFDEDKLSLPVVEKTKKGKPSMDKQVKADWLDMDLSEDQSKFVVNLTVRGKRSTSLGYMDSYRKFWLDTSQGSPWKILYSSLNPTGTSTLRWSSERPNQQQISKLMDEHDRNLRYAFGPAPGREWWSIDYDNLELRIPGYECQEPAMIELFEEPDKPPFFGSYHMLIVSILHETDWSQCVLDGGLERAGKLFKARFPLKYQWTKNGNFADMYGAVEKDSGWGTADKAYHVQGAQKIIRKKLTRKAQLNDEYIKFAQEHGFVETLPDKTVCPERGYPLQCVKNAWGKVKPTVPFNYHVQGTACWVIMRAMIKCQVQLTSWLVNNFKAFMTMQVHDELVFDLPYVPHKRNLPKIRKIRKLMESCGDDIGIPLTCGVSYHPDNWSQSV